MYIHKVQYYETDKMSITHHSNYIRWMEEARLDYFSQLGYNYDRLEAEGIISPVVTVSSNYRKTTTYPDVISIEVKVKKYNGIRLELEYSMTNEQGELVNTGNSSHCFLDTAGHILSVAKVNKEFHEILLAAVEK